MNRLAMCQLCMKLNWALLPPANEVCEGYVFTGVCLSTPGGGGVRGFIRGACMVLFGGHAWFYSGGHAWFFQFFRIQ